MESQNNNNNNYNRKFKHIGRFLSYTRQPDAAFLQSWGASLTNFFSTNCFLERKDTKEYKFGNIKALFLEG